MSASYDRPFLMLLNIQAWVKVTEPATLLAAARDYEKELPDRQRQYEYPDAIIQQV